MLTAAQTLTMLGNETLREAALQAHRILETAGVPHGVIGGVAVCLHGYRRNTFDVDLLLRPADASPAKSALEQAGWAWDELAKQFTSPGGAILKFVMAGERAGAQSEVRLPDSADAGVVTVLGELPVLTLARLIESKIASGEGNLRRTHRDFADVVELIAIHELSGDFARHLHKSLRATYRKLVRHARGEA